MNKNSGPGHLSAIQGLRAVAAMLVVFDHAIGRYVPPDSWLTPLRWQLGSLGVSVFFVISGFIMVHTSWRLQPGVGAAREFAVRRIIRIVPLYWIATAIALVGLIANGATPPVVDIIASFAFVAITTARGGMEPLLGPGWTLNYEMFFYALFAVSLVLPRRHIVLALCMALMGLVAVGSLAKPLTDTSSPSTVLSFYTDALILLFGAGSLLGVAFRAGKFSARLRPEACVVICGALLAGGVGIFLAGGGVERVGVGLRAMLAVVCVVCVMVCLLEQKARLGNVMRLLGLFGDASYSIYLFHLFTFSVCSKVIAIVWPSMPEFVAIMTLTMGAAVGGVMVYLAVERPLTNWLQKRCIPTAGSVT